MDKITENIITFINTPWSFLLLFIHSFMESSFLPGAHDFLLITVILIKRQNALLFAIFSTAGSVCGGSFAYLIGLKFGHTLMIKFIKKDKILQIEKMYAKFGLWAIAFAGFTPVPFKIFAITSGIFKIKFIPFLIISTIARSARFTIVTFLTLTMGEKVKEHTLKSFNIASIIIIIMIIIVVLSIRSNKNDSQL